MLAFKETSLFYFQNPWMEGEHAPPPPIQAIEGGKRTNPRLLLLPFHCRSVIAWLGFRLRYQPGNLSRLNQLTVHKWRESRIPWRPDNPHLPHRGWLSLIRQKKSTAQPVFG